SRDLGAGRGRRGPARGAAGDRGLRTGMVDVPPRRGGRARDAGSSRAGGDSGRMRATRRPLVNANVARISASGISKYFDLAAGLEGVISLGVGEPDFVTPERFREAAIRSIREGRTKYTSNYG